ncbi:MAG TPA: hypothetical protein VF659_23825 [Pyrinomonadaceae bacterium]|jgi:hypothetical protein
MFYLRNLFSAAGLASLAVVALTPAMFSGCRGTSSDASAHRTAQTRPAAAPTPEANIIVDEPMLAKPYAVIGGVVENVGSQRLEKLTVEIELTRRADGSLEKREVSVEPEALEPGKQGKFSLKVLSEDWSVSRVVNLRSGSRQPQDVAFKAQPGAKRPPEKVKPNVVIVKTPAQKKSGNSDFINTPDTPYSVP